jgi:hypothetical protein
MIRAVLYRALLAGSFPLASAGVSFATNAKRLTLATIRAFRVGNRRMPAMRWRNT